MPTQLDQRPKPTAAAPQPARQRQPAPSPPPERIDADTFWARLGL